MTQRLWAPWRMPYIKSDHGAEPRGCVFCHLAREADEAEGLILHRDARAFIVLNRYPYNNGHLMVIPAAHVDDLSALDAADAAHLMRLLQFTISALKRAYGCEGLNVGMNLGAAAGAGIAEHIHFHVLPRWRGDTNFMPIIADLKVIPEHLHATWLGLRPFFADLQGQDLG
ncbi:HIT domain-containing protein [Myxococcota bacterium]|nr:HIT domain-containing protein [Myxococcota bacterium]MBU1431076.1 HIT domain-containing protein [Myxococcota bacterium]MBU1896520.1 HIT domain-containing protein [Myxococcota bacterium]